MEKRIEFKKIDHVQICIPKGAEDQARSFYGDLVGLTEIEKPDKLKANGGLWFEIADIQLHIGTEDFDNQSKRHPAFEVQDVDAAKSFLIEQNVPIKEEKEIPGVKRFSFRDPFNNRIEILQKL